VQHEIVSEFNSRLAAKAQKQGLAYLLVTLSTETEFPGTFPKSPKGQGTDKSRTPEPKPEQKPPTPTSQNLQEEREESNVSSFLSDSSEKSEPKPTMADNRPNILKPTSFCREGDVIKPEVLKRWFRKVKGYL
jgi:hypothetical protein